MNEMKRERRVVAVLAADIRVAHHARMVYTAEQMLTERGCEVLIANTHGEAETAARYLKSFMERGLDGVMLIGSVFSHVAADEQVKAYLRQVPVVLANGRCDLENACSVLLDDAAGAADATGHLVAMGKRNLWFVQDLNTTGALAKREGFLRASDTLGVRGRVVEAERSIEGGRKAAKDLVASCRRFDGIVCSEDVTAVGVIKGLLSAGLRIPQDVAVTGYNNSIYARMCEPNLTTVDNKVEFVAESCVKLLLRMMNGEKVENQIVRPEIVQGWTT